MITRFHSFVIRRGIGCHVVLAMALAATLSSNTLGAQLPPAHVTADSLGSLSLSAPLRVVLRQMRGAKPELWRGQEVDYPAITFRIGALRVRAVQEHELTPSSGITGALDLDKPADFYSLDGSGGVLPGGASTADRWSELRRTLGPVVVYAEPGFPMHVRPCRYPWLIVGFAARDVTRRPGGTVSPSAIPGNAQPIYIQVRPRDRTKELGGECQHPT